MLHSCSVEEMSSRAEDLLTELASRWPNNIAILSTLAQVRLARQNWIGAQEVAETIRRIGNPRFADQILGVALSRTEQIRREYRCSSKRLRCRSRRRAANGRPGRRACACGQIGSSSRHFCKPCCNQIQITPKPMCCWVQFSCAKNAPEQAVKSFRTAIERQPKNMAGYQALAEFYVREKNNDEALKVIRAALEQQPDSFAMHLALAGVLELKGDYEAAIAEYEYLLKQQPGSLIVANNLASLLSDHRTDKASLERAYSLAAMLRKSQVPSFKDTLGLDPLSAGRLQECDFAARRSGRRAARSGLGSIPPRHELYRHGQLAKASEQLKKALELAPDRRSAGEDKGRSRESGHVRPAEPVGVAQPATR